MMFLFASLLLTLFPSTKSVEYLDDVVMVTDASGEVDVVPIELYLAPPVETVDGVDIPDREWNPGDCVGPLMLNCYWGIDNVCVEDAEQAYVDAVKAARATLVAQLKPYEEELERCLNDETVTDEACYLSYTAFTNGYFEAFDDAMAAALSTFMLANCCISICVD